MTPNTYTTKQGDMWDGIAKTVYDDEYQMQYLMEANPEHIATVIFSAGVILQVPDLPSNATQILPPWKSSS